jgi:class 3 adenylate cyclase
MITEIEIFNVKEKQSFEMRIGVNLVTVVARVLGTKNFIYDLW